jgi:hypothetical protein
MTLAATGGIADGAIVNKPLQLQSVASISPKSLASGAVRVSRGKPLIDQIIDFKMDAFTDLDALAGAAFQQRPRLRFILGFDEPFLDPGHLHGGVKGL